MQVLRILALTAGLCLAGQAASAQSAKPPVGKYNIVADVNGEPRTATLTMSVDSAGKSWGHVVLADGQTHDMSATVAGSDFVLTESSPEGDMVLKMQFHGDSLSGDWAKGDAGGTLKGARAP
jgi:hypothetical protein